MLTPSNSSPRTLRRSNRLFASLNPWPTRSDRAKPRLARDVTIEGASFAPISASPGNYRSNRASPCGALTSCLATKRETNVKDAAARNDGFCFCLGDPQRGCNGRQRRPVARSIALRHIGPGDVDEQPPSAAPVVRTAAGLFPFPAETPPASRERESIRALDPTTGTRRHHPRHSLPSPGGA